MSWYLLSEAERLQKRKWNITQHSNFLEAAISFHIAAFSLSHDLSTGGGGGGRARSLYATPPPPVLKDSGAGSANDKCP